MILFCGSPWWDLEVDLCSGFRIREERLMKSSEGGSEILSWINKSRKIEEKRNADKEKALQLSKIFEEQVDWTLFIQFSVLKRTTYDDIFFYWNRTTWMKKVMMRQELNTRQVSLLKFMCAHYCSFKKPFHCMHLKPFSLFSRFCTDLLWD